VSLPLCAASETLEPQDVATPPAAGAGGPLAGIRTLVVDDDTGVVAMLAEMLRLDGALVWTAHNFDDAIAAHHSHGPFDALLSDIGLPGRDGYQLIEALRKDANGNYRRLVALAISGYARIEDRDRALEAGFDLYFAKPFDVKQLSAAIAGLLGT
jgi:CheY-like chemotaxis protein